MVRKEDLPNNSVFGKVLPEIWALKDLLKQPKLARPPHKKPATTPKVNNDRNPNFSLFSLVIKNNLTFAKLFIFTLEKQLL